MSHPDLKDGGRENRTIVLLPDLKDGGGKTERRGRRDLSGYISSTDCWGIQPMLPLEILILTQLSTLSSIFTLVPS